MPKIKKEISERLLQLQEKLGIKNVNAIPKIEKIIVACGIWSLVTRKWQKDFEEFEKNITKITWQKSRVYKSKKAISNFKLREWLPVMLQVTLRKRRATEFLDRFVKLVLPRVRDFSWISVKSFDSNWTLNIWIPNYNIFPELSLDDVTINMWLQITIVTTAKNIEQSKIYLQDLWLIFKL